MMISFGGVRSASYLTGAEDRKGRERKSVYVLDDPLKIEVLTDSLDLEHKSATVVTTWTRPGRDPDPPGRLGRGRVRPS